MKRAVSVSLGTRSRDASVVVELLGQEISIERIGTDGDTAAARRLFQTLDGKVDALGIGGAILTFSAADQRYALSAAQRLVENVTETPVVDGAGFRNVVEGRMADVVLRELGDLVYPRTALISSAAGRIALARSFHQAGFEVVLGDLMFILGLPIPLHSLDVHNRVAHLLGPILRHLPMGALYPMGDSEDRNTPRFGRWFRWAKVIGGDCGHITRYMPKDMRGKVIVTDTTRPHDLERFRDRGVRYLATSTPRLGERSFGTNLMEATLIALAGKGRALEEHEIEDMLDRLGWRPQVLKLN